MLKIENNDPYHCKYLKIGNYVIQQLRDSYKLAGRHKGVSKNLKKKSKCLYHTNISNFHCNF